MSLRLPFLFLAALALSFGHTLATADPLVVSVSGKANIFGAGHAAAPDVEGHGGAGILPPVVSLPSQPGLAVTFGPVTGMACCNAEPVCFGPDGGRFGSYTQTVISSYGGISGILHGESVMFLVGVFINGQEPTDPAPERLDFGHAGVTDRFAELSPVLNQVFFIGDGNANGLPQVFHVPTGATRLFLGFEDAWNFEGSPGYYDDNSGHLEASVSIFPYLPTAGLVTSWGRVKALYR